MARKRSNQERLGSAFQDTDTPPQATQEQTSRDPFSFVVPTEFVDLPSQGRFYKEGHPLHGEKQVEIRYMTAKDEDILTSKNLLEKGVAVDRLIDNLLLEKRIKSQNLLSGDKNAVLIAARKSGYGERYETNVTCPNCRDTDRHVYLLTDVQTTYGLTAKELKAEGIVFTDKGTFVVDLVQNPVTVEFKLLTGREETALLKASEVRRKKKVADSLITDQLKFMIVAVNDYTETDLIDRFVNSMTMADSRHLRDVYQKVNPTVQMKGEFVCGNCSYEDELNFPFTTDFFWPQR